MPTRLDTEYGWRDFPNGDTSVNGLGVFAEMFSAEGHDVAGTTVLTPRAYNSADVIVWAPRDFAPPSQEAADWFEDWLDAGADRTLIYIHRDYDAAPAYWRKVAPSAPASLAAEASRRSLQAQLEFTTDRAAMNNGMTSYHWFQASAAGAPRTATSLRGDPEWTSGVNAAQAEIELNGAVKPLFSGQTVLQSGAGDSLIIQEDRASGSRVLVLANGSFVLNYPLINKEHRKLAGKLVDSVSGSAAGSGSPGNNSVGNDKYVVFLQSTSEPRISDEEVVAQLPTAFNFLWIEPINHVLFHMIVFALLLCFARFPIFGIPRGDSPDDQSDFGRHIEAMGVLLEKTHNRPYAVASVKAYWQLVGSDHAAKRQLAFNPQKAATSTGAGQASAPHVVGETQAEVARPSPGNAGHMPLEEKHGQNPH